MIRKAIRIFLFCLGGGLILVALFGFYAGCDEWNSHKELSALGVFFGSLIFGVPGVIIFGMAWGDAKQQRDKERKDQEESDRFWRAREAEQARLTHNVTQLVSGTRSTFESLPGIIASAEAALDRAEKEFSDGAFAPFWDAVERAITGLASSDACVRTIAQNSTRFTEEIRKLEKPPRLEFPTSAFPEAAPTLARMATIVRQAQKDFHFATIYEQRRTNGILVAGFANLACALDDMGTRIQGSIRDLAQTLDSAITSMAQVQSDQVQELISGMSTVREQLASDSEKRRQHEGAVEGMLDNIQRRRRPLPERIGDGKY